MLRRIREVLAGEQHAAMEALPATADRCCCDGQTFWKPAPPGTGPPGDPDASATSSDTAADQRCSGVPFRVIITGHSLGGAAPGRRALHR